MMKMTTMMMHRTNIDVVVISSSRSSSSSSSSSCSSSSSGFVKYERNERTIMKKKKKKKSIGRRRPRRIDSSMMREGVDVALVSAVALSMFTSYSYDDSDSGRNSSVDYDDDRDMIWTIAQVVSLIPVVSVISWIAPNIAVGRWEQNERSDRENERARRMVAFAGVYFLCFARFGFDFARKETWIVTLMSFVHLKFLESPRRSDGGGDDDYNDDDSNMNNNISLMIAKDIRESVVVNNTNTNNSRGSITIKEDSSSSSSKGEEVVREEVRNRFAKRLGEYIGELEVQLKNLPIDIQEGRLRAEIEREIEATEEILIREKTIADDEIEKWDQRWILRRLSKKELLDLSRSYGLKGHSKLNKIELIRMIENFRSDDDNE